MTLCDSGGIRCRERPPRRSEYPETARSPFHYSHGRRTSRITQGYLNLAPVLKKIEGYRSPYCKTHRNPIQPDTPMRVGMAETGG